jgi:hypothetical protein
MFAGERHVVLVEAVLGGEDLASEATGGENASGGAGNIREVSEVLAGGQAL